MGFALFLFIGHVGVGFLDASTDAWVIDESKKEESGKLNASMNIGKMTGFSLFGPIFVMIGVSYGYNLTFFTSGIIILLIAILTSLVKYSDLKPYKEKMWSLIREEFKYKSTQITTLFIFLGAINPGIILAIIVLYAKNILNLDDTTVGLITAVMILAIIPGSIVGGMISDRYGRKKPIIFFLSIVAISSVGFMFASNLINFIIVIALFDFSWHAAQPCIWALAMDITNPKIGASELSIIYSIANLGDVGSGAIAGTLVVMLGFQNVFLIAGIVLIPAIITLTQLRNNRKR